MNPHSFTILLIFSIVLWNHPGRLYAAELSAENIEKLNAHEHLLNAGDLVCRTGVGIWSWRFRAENRQERYFSHCGIVTPKDGKWYVIHASADDLTGCGKVSSEPLETFAKKSTHLAIYRLPFPEEVRTGIAENAEKYLGVPFDLGFSLKTQDRVYCSELAAICINQAAGREVVELRKDKEAKVTIDDLYLPTKAVQLLEIRQKEAEEGSFFFPF